MEKKKAFKSCFSTSCKIINNENRVNDFRAEECHYNYVSQNVPDGGVCLCCVESCNHFTMGPKTFIKFNNSRFLKPKNMAVSGSQFSCPLGIGGFPKCARWWCWSLC